MVYLVMVFTRGRNFCLRSELIRGDSPKEAAAWILRDTPMAAREDVARVFCIETIGGEPFGRARWVRVKREYPEQCPLGGGMHKYAPDEPMGHKCMLCGARTWVDKGGNTWYVPPTVTLK